MTDNVYCSYHFVITCVGNFTASRLSTRLKAGLLVFRLLLAVTIVSWVRSSFLNNVKPMTVDEIASRYGIREKVHCLSLPQL
jgi:hypothetical protein